MAPKIPKLPSTIYQVEKLPIIRNSKNQPSPFYVSKDWAALLLLNPHT